MSNIDFPRKPRLGLWTLIASTLFLILFVAWLGVYQVEEVTRVPGILEPSVGNAPIQFPSSGIITDLLVKDGQKVTKGEILLRINSLGAADTVDSIKEQIAVLAAQRVRMDALANDKDLTTSALAAIRPSLRDNQLQLFQGEMGSYRASLDVFDNQKRSLGLQIQEKQAEIKALESDLKLANEELGIQNNLAKEGITSRTQLITLERELEALKAKRENLPVTIQQLQEDFQVIESKRREFIQNHFRDYRKEMARIDEELAVLRTRVASGQKANQHLELTSPIDGVVTGLTKRRSGESVTSNERIMEIVPEFQKFQASLRIPSQSIGYLTVGLPATIVLDAYVQEPKATLRGVLLELSIASQLDEKNTPYYRGSVSIDGFQLELNQGNFPLLSGMSLKSQIITGRRTILEYMLNTIIRSSSEAFRER